MAKDFWEYLSIFEKEPNVTYKKWKMAKFFKTSLKSVSYMNTQKETIYLEQNRPDLNTLFIKTNTE